MKRIAIIAATLALSTSAHATCYTVSWDQLTMSILSPIPAEQTKLVPCYVCGGGSPPPDAPPTVELTPPPIDILPHPPIDIIPPPGIVPPIVIPTPVPEPSTWALMLIGFATLAYAGFKRRVKCQQSI